MIPSVLSPRHARFWLVAALLFGVLVLPFLVHLTGRIVLGPYSGGAAAFLGDYLKGLLTLRWYSWLLALGPVVIVAFWRIFVISGSTSIGSDHATR